jgi:hypothetical protein
MIAALFVARRGAYFGIPDVDLWDEKRDARTYAGPWPVVAHPPCSRWCRLAGLVEARWGHARGDDGGCFASALASVRAFGGVLEHPAYTDAWRAFDLPEPPHSGWLRAFCGGWVAHVEQHRYGHPAKKATWLYAVRTDLPSLRWGKLTDAIPGAVYWTGPLEKPARVVGFTKNRTPKHDTRPRLTKREASATPPEFRDLLLSLARSVKVAA